MADVFYGLRLYALDDSIGATFIESGRREARTRALIGNLAHELCVWTDVRVDAGIEDVVDQVRENIMQTMRHAMPLWWMMRRYNSGPDAVETFRPGQLDDRFKVPWLYFSVVDARSNRLRLPGVEVSQYPRRTEIPFMRTPVLMITVLLRADSATLTCDHPQVGYNPEAVEAVLERANPGEISKTWLGHVVIADDEWKLHSRLDRLARLYHLSPRATRGFALCGTEADVLLQLADYRAAGVDGVIVTVLDPGDVDYVRRVGEVLRRGFDD